MEVVVERIGPENDGGGSGVYWFSLLEPTAKALLRKCRDWTFRRNSGKRFGYAAQHRRLDKKIRCTGPSRRKPRPSVNLAEGVVVERAIATFIMMRKKLGFVGRDIYSH